MLHPVYLLFDRKQLLSHINQRHLSYYTKSIERYEQYLARHPVRRGQPLRDMREPCQIEKDEKFWIATCMMTMFYSQNRLEELTQIFEKAYGQGPPINVESWRECFKGPLYLFFEANLPSPISYKKWLLTNLRKRHFIPYVLDSAFRSSERMKSNLEGSTNVDAIILNAKNGFATIIEAKVLSDISVDVTYDVSRNQIARNIDVMLERNYGLSSDLISHSIFCSK